MGFMLELVRCRCRTFILRWGVPQGSTIDSLLFTFNEILRNDVLLEWYTALNVKHTKTEWYATNWKTMFKDFAYE